VNIFNQITEEFAHATSTWQIMGISIAQELFSVLALIQLIWSTALWMLNKDDPNVVLAGFLRKMIMISIFWQLITNYDAWVPAIINNFRTAGMKISGTSIISPGDVFEQGLHLTTLILNSSAGVGWIPSMIGSLVAVLIATTIFFIFTRIAVEMILILIGSRIILVGGIIMLGFAGSKWTQNYAERYFAAAITVGIKMLFITLIVGLGEPLSKSWVTLIETASKGTLTETYFSVLGATLVYGYLAIRIPDMAATMLSGNLSMGFSDAPASAMTTGRSAIRAGSSITDKTIGTAKTTAKTASHIGSKIKEGYKESSQYLSGKTPSETPKNP
jgi:type IV secretion system protein TrbL